MNATILKKRKNKDQSRQSEGTTPIMNKNVKSTSSDSRKGPAKKSGWLTDLRYGRAMSVDLFKRNAWLLLFIMVLIVSLIGLRYKTKTKMVEIKRLERELSQSESEKIREKAQYMSLVRESEMLRLTNEKHLGLEFQEQPPYNVDYYKEK